MTHLDGLFVIHFAIDVIIVHRRRRVSIVASMMWVFGTATLVPRLLNVIGLQETRHQGSIFMEIWMFCVDVRQFNGNNILDHRICVGQTAAQQLSDHIDDFLVQFRESTNSKVMIKLPSILCEASSSDLSISCWTSLPQCWMILCISSWISSTQRNDGSSRRRICRFTNSSNDTCEVWKLLVLSARLNFRLELLVYFYHLLTWNASVQTSGTNNAGRGPVAFRMAVKMSIFVRPTWKRWNFQSLWKI